MWGSPPQSSFYRRQKLQLSGGMKGGSHFLSPPLWRVGRGQKRQKLGERLRGLSRLGQGYPQQNHEHCGPQLQPASYTPKQAAPPPNYPFVHIAPRPLNTVLSQRPTSVAPWLKTFETM